MLFVSELDIPDAAGCCTGSVAEYVSDDDHEGYKVEFEEYEPLYLSRSYIPKVAQRTLEKGTPFLHYCMSCVTVMHQFPLGLSPLLT